MAPHTDASRQDYGLSHAAISIWSADSEFRFHARIAHLQAGHPRYYHVAPRKQIAESSMTYGHGAGTIVFSWISRVKNCSWEIAIDCAARREIRTRCRRGYECILPEQAERHGRDRYRIAELERSKARRSCSRRIGPSRSMR